MMKTDLKDIKGRELKLGDTIATCGSTYELDEFGVKGKEYWFSTGKVFFEKGRLQWSGNSQYEYRVYDCGDCGYKVDRDFNSANNMLKEGLKKIGVEYTESTPVEIEPLRVVMEKLNAIPRLCASLVGETGSPRYL